MESERAMGDSRLHTLHNELIEDRNNLKTYERVSCAGTDLVFSSICLPGGMC